MYKRHQTGKIGEDIACMYLEKMEYKIVERNFSCRQGEIDIIAWDEAKKELVFIEVKTRKNSNYGKPADAVNSYKLKHIYNAAQYFVYKNKIRNTYLRFDIIEVYIHDKNIRINQIKRIF